MNDPEVWIYVSSTGSVTAYDTQHAAENAACDDPEPWIECVQVHQQPSEAPVSPEPAEDAQSPERVGKRRETGTQRITVPTSLGRDAHYWNPWNGGDAA